MKHYRSSIPKAATERVLATHLNRTQKYKTEYLLNVRNRRGAAIRREWPSRLRAPYEEWQTHGTLYDIDDGVVTFAEPYRNGVVHGTVKQWSHDGELIGTYTMKHGTGLDLWHAKYDWGKGRVYLSEARYVKEGKWHGFEWWLDENQKSVHSEHHFWENLQHGIERRWNSQHRLRRGFPRYWVNNKQVTKREYLRACASDPNLPPFRESDNRPRRTFPPEVLNATNLAS